MDLAETKMQLQDEHTAAVPWGEAPFCLGCGRPWPCDASVLVARVRKLEAWLREYGQHQDGRAYIGRYFNRMTPPECSCGLAALAGGEAG